MIKFLIVHIRLLIEFLLQLPMILVQAVKTLVRRIKEKYYTKPHFKSCIGVYGKFGSGKGVFTIWKLRKILKRYKHCDYRVLSNMTLNLEQFKSLGMTQDKYRFFSNVDDIDWLMEKKIDPKTGKEVPAFDFGVFIIDELPTVASNRDIMNSKKGKGVITKDFLALLHQLRKLNVLVIVQFQDDAIDIAFRRIMDTIYVPHMHLLNSFNLVKTYNPRALFAYLEDPNAPTPEYLFKSCFLCTDSVFKSYDTHELVMALAEGDYFRAGDKDAPTYLSSGSTVISSPQHKKGLQRLLAGTKV